MFTVTMDEYARMPSDIRESFNQWLDVIGLTDCYELTFGEGTCVASCWAQPIRLVRAGDDIERAEPSTFYSHGYHGNTFCG